jgi:hypothetical protein
MLVTPAAATPPPPPLHRPIHPRLQVANLAVGGAPACLAKADPNAKGRSNMTAQIDEFLQGGRVHGRMGHMGACVRGCRSIQHLPKLTLPQGMRMLWGEHVRPCVTHMRWGVHARARACRSPVRNSSQKQQSTFLGYAVRGRACACRGHVR